MATFYLINTITVGTTKMLPGSLVDDAVEDSAAILAAGGSLWPTSNATIAAAALRAQNAHTNRGASEEELEGIMQVAVDTAQGASASVPTTRTVTAGAGLTGGGDLSANRTFDVAANADGSIVANANDLQVGVLATDAQHGVRGGGTQHAAATISVAGFESAADKTKLDSIQTGLLTLVAGVVTLAAGITITASSRIFVGINTPAGAALGVSHKIPSGSRVVGGPGTGAFTVTAIDATGATVVTDTSTIDYLIVG